MMMQISLWDSVFISFRYIAKHTIAGSYWGYSFNFSWRMSILFSTGCTKLHFHQQCTRVSFSLHSHQHLLFLVFLIIIILTSVSWYLILVWICISLMISDVEHILMYCWSFGCLLWKNIYLNPLPILISDYLFFTAIEL